MKALLHCNASLDDIREFYENGRLDDDFIKFVIKVFYADTSYNSHTQDAIEIERNRRLEEAKAKAKLNGKGKS